MDVSFGQYQARQAPALLRIRHDLKFNSRIDPCRKNQQIMHEMLREPAVPARSQENGAQSHDPDSKLLLQAKREENCNPFKFFLDSANKDVESSFWAYSKAADDKITYHFHLDWQS